MVGETEVPSRAYVASFGFKGSGPAEARWRFVRRRAQPTEPGAHAQAGRQPAAARRAHQRLDVETLSSLEAALLGVPGCSVVISHDRMFLDRVATHILAWEGTDENPGNWHWFEGNFEAYQANRIEAPGRGRGQAASYSPQADARLDRYAVFPNRVTARRCWSQVPHLAVQPSLAYRSTRRSLSRQPGATCGPLAVGYATSTNKNGSNPDLDLSRLSLLLGFFDFIDSPGGSEATGGVGGCAR